MVALEQLLADFRALPRKLIYSGLFIFQAAACIVVGNEQGAIVCLLLAIWLKL